MKKKLNTILIVALLASIILAVVSTLFFQPQPKSYIKINNVTLNIELADTPEKTYQGLSDREELADETGMLFVFPDGYSGGFEMRRMKFPLDILWIKDFTVAKIDKNLPTPFQTNNIPAIVYSPGIVQYVLEVKAGWSDKHNITIGDKAEIVIY